MRGSAASHSQSLIAPPAVFVQHLGDAVLRSLQPGLHRAFCVIEQTFDVEWLCSAFEAATTSFGASVQPQRQPVIAYAFDAEPHSTERSRSRDESTRTRLCGTGS